MKLASFTEYFKAFSYIRRKIIRYKKSNTVSCNCSLCLDPLSYYNEEAHKSKSNFLKFLLCPQQSYTELLRHKTDLLTQEKLTSLKSEILANDNKKLSEVMEDKAVLGEVLSRKIKMYSQKYFMIY